MRADGGRLPLEVGLARGGEGGKDGFDVVRLRAGTIDDLQFFTAEGDVLNLKSQLTQLLVLSGALGQGVIKEATVVCDDTQDESRLFRLNLYRE